MSGSRDVLAASYGRPESARPRSGGFGRLPPGLGAGLLDLHPDVDELVSSWRRSAIAAAPSERGSARPAMPACGFYLT
jgi:formylglycine-generating enzyme required for sulfatase activity